MSTVYLRHPVVGGLTWGARTREAYESAIRQGWIEVQLSSASDPMLSIVAPGGTDQQQAINAAIKQATAEGRPLHLPDGVYSMSGPVTLPQGATLDMAPGAVLDFSKIRGPFIKVEGSSGVVAPAGALDKGSMSISGAVVAKPGDWLHLTSSDVFDQHSTGILQGELARVREVKDGLIHLFAPLCDTYMTDVKVSVVDMCDGVTICGGVIRGSYTPDSNSVGVDAVYAKDLRIKGVRFEGIDDSHVRLTNCVGAVVDDCHFDWAVHSTRAYGVSFKDATRDSTCKDSYFLNVRHSLSTNNSGAPQRGGIVRRITFTGNTCEYTSTALGGSSAPGDCIDTHTAAEDIIITENIVNGCGGSGVNFECASGRIHGNRIISPGSHGVYVHNESDRNGRIVVESNIVTAPAKIGIIAQTGTRGTTAPYESIIINDNQVLDSKAEGIRAGNPKLVDEGVSITGNAVTRSALSGISVQSAKNLIVSGNNVETTSSSGLNVRSAVGFSIGANTITGRSETGSFYGAYVGGSSHGVIYPGSVISDNPNAIGVRIDDTSSNVTVGAAGHMKVKTAIDNRQVVR